MKRVIYIILILICAGLYSIVSLASEYEYTIPEDAVEFNGHYYKLYDFNMPWEEAEDYCESVGGYLATITSPEENQFLYDYIISLGYESAYFGLTDKENEDVWQWVTGEDYIYSNWHSGEPNNERENEDYGMFYYKYRDGTWNDGGFNTVNAGVDSTAYICEWNSVDSEIIDEKESMQQNKNDDSDNNGSLTFVFRIDNLSLFGGISIVGGISLIGLMWKRHNKDDD